MTSEDDLYADEEVVAESKFCDTVVGGPTSTPLKIAGLTVYLAGDVTVGVASSSDLSGDATVGVASSADLAGDVSVGVVSSADLAGVVTAGVTSSTDPDEVTTGVEPSITLDGEVTAGVAYMEEYAESDCVCDYDDYFYDGQYDDRPDYYDYLDD